MEKNILVIAAHPDDEVLGCGGTVKRLSDEGNNLYIAILGEGITSRHQKSAQADKAEVEKLKKTSYEVSQLLGAKKLFQHELPDNRFDTVPLLDTIKIIEDIIAQVKPSIIFTHHISDLNVDHKIVGQAVLTATRPVGPCVVDDIYMFEVPSSTEWSYGSFKPIFNPNVFYDISTTFEFKVKAFGLYEGESREYPHPRSKRALKAIAERWGTVAGIHVAEAFELVRSIR